MLPTAMLVATAIEKRVVALAASSVGDLQQSHLFDEHPGFSSHEAWDKMKLHLPHFEECVSDVLPAMRVSAGQFVEVSVDSEQLEWFVGASWHCSTLNLQHAWQHITRSCTCASTSRIIG